MSVLEVQIEALMQWLWNCTKDIRFLNCTCAINNIVCFFSGDFGKYQFFQFALHNLAAITAGLHMLTLVTVAAVPDHRYRHYKRFWPKFLLNTPSWPFSLLALLVLSIRSSPLSSFIKELISSLLSYPFKLLLSHILHYYS